MVRFHLSTGFRRVLRRGRRRVRTVRAALPGRLRRGAVLSGNARIVAAWFPASERGTASAIFNSAQYFATVLFSPLMAWIASAYGWQTMFAVMGGIGFVFAAIWLMTVYGPKQHPLVNQAELDYIEAGGALVSIEQRAESGTGPKWAHLKQLLSNRMLLGIYIGQYCITTLTYFFLTWFPVYLVQARGMSILKAGFVASLPAVCGFIGGVLGGVVSDHLLRRGFSLTVARRLPELGGQPRRDQQDDEGDPYPDELMTRFMARSQTSTNKERMIR
ncbi:MAG: MFS transporter [Aliidongia sp.]